MLSLLIVLALALAAWCLWPAPGVALKRVLPPVASWPTNVERPAVPKFWTRAGGDVTLDLATALTEVAAVLRTGVTTAGAWRVVAEAHPAGASKSSQVINSLARHAALGYPLRDSLTCQQLGASGAALMAAEAVSARTGAPIGTLLTTIADALRAEVDATAIRKAAYAGPKATVRVLAALPFASLGLGYLMGADPIAAFTDGWIGHLALVSGLGLAAAGWLVPQRMVDRAEQRGSIQ